MVALMNKLGMDAFVAQFADSPAALAYLEATFAGEHTSEQTGLLEAVDASDFSLRQWVEALMVLSQWLDVRQLELSITDQVGYVCCAAEAAVGATNLTYLPSLVEEMLTEYGCERAVKL